MKWSSASHRSRSLALRDLVARTAAAASVASSSTIAQRPGRASSPSPRPPRGRRAAPAAATPRCGGVLVVGDPVDLDVHPRLADRVLRAPATEPSSTGITACSCAGDVAADVELRVDHHVHVAVLAGQLHRQRVDEERHVVGDDLDDGVAAGATSRASLTAGVKHPHLGGALRAGARRARSGTRARRTGRRRCGRRRPRGRRGGSRTQEAADRLVGRPTGPLASQGKVDRLGQEFGLLVVERRGHVSDPRTLAVGTQHAPHRGPWPCRRTLRKDGAMRLRHEHFYDDTPSAVFAMLADPAFREKVSAAQDVVSAKVAVDRPARGSSSPSTRSSAPTGCRRSRGSSPATRTRAVARRGVGRRDHRQPPDRGPRQADAASTGTIALVPTGAGTPRGRTSSRSRSRCRSSAASSRACSPSRSRAGCEIEHEVGRRLAEGERLMSKRLAHEPDVRRAADRGRRDARRPGLPRGGLRRRSACSAAIGRRSTPTATGSGHIDQVQARDGIPSFAKKFVGDEINIVQHETWRRADRRRHHGRPSPASPAT